MFSQYLVQKNVISSMQVAALNRVGRSYDILKDKVEPNALTEVIPRDSGDIANELTVLEYKSYAIIILIMLSINHLYLQWLRKIPFGKSTLNLKKEKK